MQALAAQAHLLAVLNAGGDTCLGVGAVRQEHGHGCAGVCLSEADAGAGGAFLGGRVLCAAKAATHAAEVGAGEAGGATAAAAEQAAEQVVNVDIGAGAAAESAEGVRAGVAATTEAAETAHTRCAVAANLVVLLALLLVGEHVVRFGDFLELLLSLLVTGVQVRVVLAGELAVRLLNVAFACVFANAQCLVEVVSYPVFTCHVCFLLSR